MTTLKTPHYNIYKVEYIIPKVSPVCKDINIIAVSKGQALTHFKTFAKNKGWYIIITGCWENKSPEVQYKRTAHDYKVQCDIIYKKDSNPKEGKNKTNAKGEKKVCRKN